jgi:SAM-dependent methyltransferase
LRLGRRPGITRAEEFEQSWRRRFERFGQTHQDDAPISGWSPGGLEARFGHFRRTWNAAAGGFWLDAGCGPGTYTRYLVDSGQRVIGVDYSLPSLKKARDRSQAGIPWIVADVQRLPVREAGFDGVLCFGVLQALAGPERAVQELAAAVRPGGWLWIDALNDWCLLSRWQRWKNPHPAHPLRYDSPRRLRQLLERHGFRDVSVDWVPIAPGSRAAWQSRLESPLVERLLRWFRPAAWALCHAVVVRGQRQ